MEFNLTKGLDLSLKGEITNQDLPNEKNLTSRVALLGTDFHGIRPTMFVAEGQEVKQGEIIGTVGSTGRSTGPHLDVRLNWFGTRLDPATVLNLN